MYETYTVNKHEINIFIIIPSIIKPQRKNCYKIISGKIQGFEQQRAERVHCCMDVAAIHYYIALVLLDQQTNCHKLTRCYALSRSISVRTVGQAQKKTKHKCKTHKHLLEKNSKAENL